MVFSTHRVTFRYAAIHSDRAAVVEQRGIRWHLPAAYSTSRRQEVIGDAFCVQPSFKGMTLQSMNVQPRNLCN